MQRIKSEKGITILVLAITVIVLMLISIPILVNTSEVTELQKYTYFKADIDRLRESIGTVYLNENNIASIGEEYVRGKEFLEKEQNGEKVKNPNDGEKYYIIDLDKLNSYINAQIELNYGDGNKNLSLNTTDIYIINEQSRTIYYVSGIKYKEKVYYRLPEDFTQISNLYTIVYDANKGTGAPDMQTVEATGDATIQLPTAPTRAGATFIGWKEEGTNNIYNPADSYTVRNSTKFIAQWQ